MSASASLPCSPGNGVETFSQPYAGWCRRRIDRVVVGVGGILDPGLALKRMNERQAISGSSTLPNQLWSGSAAGSPRRVGGRRPVTGRRLTDLRDFRNKAARLTFS